MQIVSFDGLVFLTALVLSNQLDYMSHFNKDSDWLSCSVLCESMEHADETVGRLGNKVSLKIESIAWGIKRILYYKTKEKP